jgi:hypothetical protein
MTRFTKWLAAVAVVAGVGFASQAASAAGPVVVQPTFYPNPGPFPPRPLPYPGPRVDYDYVVIYKPSFFAPWVVYGKFETYSQARHAERRLEWNGFAVRIERVRDHHHGGYGW